MSINKVVHLNALLVLGIAAYGILTDEPYFRAVGHLPSLFDYLFWSALALNGPSGFAADYGSSLIISSSSNLEWGFVIQYALWLLLLWPQWKVYDAVATWCIGHRGRETSLYVAIAAFTLIGCVAAYEAWIYGHQPSEFAFIDRYFWFVRIAGATLSGVVVLAYRQSAKRRRAR